jgi:L-fuculose-phosphate aldolase
MKPCPFEFATEWEAREQIIHACLEMNASGLNHGKTGNISVRWNRSAAPGMLITPTAIPYEQLEPDDLVWMPLEGSAQTDGLIDPKAAKPSSEWPMHHALYTSPQAAINAVVHTHSEAATTLACMPRVQQAGIPAFHYMVGVAGGHDIRCARYATFGSKALAQSMLLAMEGRSACLLANHGVIASSNASGGIALQRALTLAGDVESLARMYVQALQLGEPAVLDIVEMQRVVRQFGAMPHKDHP